ncbi:MAG: NAD(P)-dependent glycerol-3-phosphate dehydrogenase [Candidatus Omnitrophica bacterium]|nr:NAD(P)-dependent glycerol-3-phosphate dehydrogenase [Candidatus Omnitrophota bacterium]MBU2044377.1 NAD(P)-dependent glycerol-3-phosphate dehydrogenase [Candidatus Omnitrophota bacterium]MBU2265850.1 NAD(P)-dependent glycerol-3-phosphate dehydrogenase [Candidatus Omnitrophota bacterium]MBU2473353.1 NAD(P)-dependent glycerol-3-phosphate dehydrogenase [Candidatus Omnitrophota bacterium]
MKEKVSIIGAGSWGTTLAVVLARKKVAVDLHSLFPSHNLQMLKTGQNSLFLKGVKFPQPLRINPCLENTLDNEIIIFAVPVKFVRKVLQKIKRQKFSLKGKILVSVSKGIEAASLKRTSEIIAEELASKNIAVLSGPNIAREVLAGIPSAAILASKTKSFGKRLQALFNSPTFRVYLHDDLTGVELGGALKNIIAIACGISDGLGFGTNTKAALVTRGLVEITRLGKKLGADPETFWGISGLGDLVTTCFSPDSRNRSLGQAIGEGKKVKAIIKKMTMVAEGLETVKSAYRLSEKIGVDLPITRQVYAVLYRAKPPKQAVVDLMNRPLKSERIA